MKNQKYHTVRTIPKSDRKILKEAISTHNIYIYCQLTNDMIYDKLVLSIVCFRSVLLVCCSNENNKTKNTTLPEQFHNTIAKSQKLQNKYP